MSVHFALARVIGFLYARNRAGFEDVSFFNQFIHALRVCIFGLR